MFCAVGDAVEFVVSLEKKTKVRRAYLVVAAAALLLVVFVLLMHS